MGTVDDRIVYTVAGIMVAAMVASVVMLFLPTRRPQPLHPSGVGPHVHHPEVHEGVRREFTDRAEWEVSRRARADVHPGISGVFGSNYPRYSNCCS